MEYEGRRQRETGNTKEREWMDSERMQEPEIKQLVFCKEGSAEEVETKIVIWK